MHAERHTPPALRAILAVLTALAVALVGAGCGVSSGADSADGERRLRMIIPNSPGGGYDLTGRAAAKVLEDEGLTGRFEISNMEGASGTVAMQRMLNEEGSDDLMLLMGLRIVPLP